MKIPKQVYSRDVSRLFIIPTEVIVNMHVTVENGITNGATPVMVLHNLDSISHFSGG